jgi:hypothetical protein
VTAELSNAARILHVCAVFIFLALGAGLDGCADRSTSVVPALRDHAGHRKPVTLRNPVTPPDPGSGGCLDASCGTVPLCPDCVLNPELTNALPADLSSVADPATACASDGITYDPNGGGASVGVCFSSALSSYWSHSSFTYGQCSSGSYQYDLADIAYKLTCTIPAHSGGTTILATMTSVTGPPIALATRYAFPTASTQTWEAVGMQSIFTNLNLCFMNYPAPLIPVCYATGGGMSVGKW